VAHVMKKVSIAIMVAVFVATTCLSLVILPLKAYADSVPYAIGDTGPAGGLVFYVNGSNCLEAAPEDIADPFTSVWSDVINTLVPGGTATGIGTGQANTIAIVAQSSTLTIAARICADYTTIVSGDTYDDWFLPSKDELNLMYENLRVAGLGGFDIGRDYWSSSEGSAANAWLQNFSAGSPQNVAKGNFCKVRPIRTFTGMKETGSAASAPIIEKPWVRTGPMVCYQVWINADNKFQFVFWYPYRDNNWVRIYDMSGKMVYEIDMPYDNPNLIVDLPNGMYSVKTFNDQPEPLQTFVIGK
jgi:hypothetical protein